LYKQDILTSEVIPVTLELRLIIFDTTLVKHFLLGIGLDSLACSTYLPAVLEIFITICTGLLTYQFVFHFTDGKPRSSSKYRVSSLPLLCAVSTELKQLNFFFRVLPLLLVTDGCYILNFVTCDK
jgi:hypothetical protein